MRIHLQQNKMLSAGSEVLVLSRTIRQAGAEIGEIEGRLRKLSELDTCRYELRRQKERLDLITGRLVNLSASLCEIAELYARTERRNEYGLEERVTLRNGATTGDLYASKEVHIKVQRILGNREDGSWQRR